MMAANLMGLGGMNLSAFQQQQQQFQVGRMNNLMTKCSRIISDAIAATI